MADEKTYSQADVDALLEKTVGPLKSKLDEVMDEAKEAKRKLRAASEIKPEDLTAAEERADKAEAKLCDLEKQNKALTTDLEKQNKALETEQAAARSFALEAEISSAIAEGNVVPALVPALKAMIATQAKAELVDGKYVVTVGDKAARDHIKGYLDGEDGKAFRSAMHNGGGGAPGSGAGGAGGNNPFAKDTYNMTKQGEIIKADPAQAMALAKAAGVELKI